MRRTIFMFNNNLRNIFKQGDASMGTKRKYIGSRKMAQKILENNKGNIGLTDFKFLFLISSKKDKATQIQFEKMKKICDKYNEKWLVRPQR